MLAYQSLLKKIGGFWKEVATEVALVIASIYIPGGILWLGARTGRWILRAKRLARVAKLIARIKQAHESSRWLYYGGKVLHTVKTKKTSCRDNAQRLNCTIKIMHLLE